MTSSSSSSPDLIRGPSPDLSFSAALFLFRAKTQRHEEDGLGQQALLPADGAAGRTVAKESRFAAGATSLRLCAKNNWRCLYALAAPRHTAMTSFRFARPICRFAPAQAPKRKKAPAMPRPFL